MDLNIKPDESATESPVKRKAVQAPPDYTSRGMRMKLFVLVGALMFVLVLMNEARKPENWKWMGFDEKGRQIQKDESPKSLIIQEQQYDPITAPQNGVEMPTEDSSEEKSNESDTSFSDPVQQIQESDPSGESLVEVEFWKLLYRQLDLDGQRGLFSRLRQLRNRTFPNEREFDRDRLLARMDSFVKARRNAMLNELSLLEDGHPRRESLSDRLQTFEEQWDQWLLPALSGEVKSDNPSMQQMLRQFQLVMDEAAYGAVIDRTAATRAADDPAWLRTWERLEYGWDGEESVGEVTPIQLSAESKFYRGKLVDLSGELWGIERVSTRNSPLGIKEFYSAWIKTSPSAIRPTNLYLTRLPRGIELSEKRYTGFDGIPLNVSGVFFKVRTYEDAKGTYRDTPMIFGGTVDVLEKVVVSEVDVAGQSWTPARWQLILFFVGMPLLAIVIAVWTYRGTLSRRYRPGEQVTSQINESLGQLADDPSIKSVQERLAAMENEGATG